MIDLSDYDLHDGIIENIEFNSNKNLLDSVTIEITLTNGCGLKIEFLNCVLANARFLSWIHGKDSIRFWIDQANADVEEKIKNRRKQYHISSVQPLHYFWFETNITGSTFEILCCDVQVLISG